MFMSAVKGKIKGLMKPGDEYYDGPIEYYGDAFGRTVEEIEEFLEEERERMQKVELPEEYDGY